MTQSKHTPGPWLWHKENTQVWNVFSGKGRETFSVARLSKHTWGGEDPEPKVYETYTEETMQANARLIAAAPDLLKELERSHGALQSMWVILSAQGQGAGFQKSLDEQMERNAAAIAKATGAA